MRRGAVALLAALLFVGLLVSSSRAARANNRHIGVVLDTSGSMTENDRPHYTVQATKILSDLLDDHDRLIAVRMPASETCSDGPNPALGVVWSAADRAGFKSALDAKMRFDTGTYFTAPVRTALDFLSSTTGGQRLFVIVADAGGFGDCAQPLTSELLSFRGAGGMVSLVALGEPPTDPQARGFFKNQAFSSVHQARTSRELLEAIAAVYQSFLGSRKPQTGDVTGRVEVTIDELVSEAFLVVAADGPVGQLSSPPQNPYAAAMDLDLYGGGRTKGEDDVERAYRVVRLTKPDAGKWVFDAEGLSTTAGYLLIQDYAVELRMVSPGEVPLGRDNRLAFEVVDPRTGKRVDSPAFLKEVGITVTVGGKKVELTRAPDGTFSAQVRFDRKGRETIVAELKGDHVAKTATAEVEVVQPAWALVAEVPPRADVDSPIKVAVRVVPGDPSAPAPDAYPDCISVRGAEGALDLTDDGRNGDEHAGDHLYTAEWTPRVMGSQALELAAVGGAKSTPASATVDVIGKLRFGDAVPIDIGPVRSRGSGTAVLSFAGAEVKGEFDLRLTSTFSSRGAAFEIDAGSGFVPLEKRPVALRLKGHGPREFQVRLRTGSCPVGCTKQDPAELTVRTKGPDGAPVELKVPVKIEVVPDPWLQCYWPFLVVAAALLAGAILFHGYWSPSRFSPQIGVKLSPEEDIEEGVFYTIRAQPGTRSGFYRDARAYISSDFRLSGSSRGAIARLRAQGSLVMIQPAGGASILLQSADGEWEPLDAAESRIRFGTLYRDDQGKIYFQLRTG